MADDARVHAQLELLYRLGVIDREQPSQQATYEAEVAGRPAFTLSELTGGSEDGGEDTGDRVGSRVHPMDANIRSRKNAFHASRSSMRRIKEDALRAYLQVPMWKPTERRFRDDSRSPTSSRSRDTRYENSSREHSRKRQNLVNAAASPTLRLVNVYAKKKAKAREREDVRMYFLYWKLFLQSEREKASLNAIWKFHVKKCFWTKWWYFVRCKARVRAQTNALLAWKARRTAIKWRVWATRSQLIQLRLGNTRCSVVSQLRKRRVWTRWTRFAVANCHYRTLLQKQLAQMKQQIVRRAWQELKIYACRSRQCRRGLRKYFKALKLYKHNKEFKQQTLLQHQRTLNAHIRRRALLQWSRVASSQRSTRCVQQQILFRISRKRYFHVWRDCFQENRFIAEIKQRHASRSLQRHFVAWYFTAKALQMGQKKAESTRINTRELLFQEWRKETHFGIRCQYAAHECERLRKLNAIRKLQSWKIARRRQRHKEGAWKIRLLHHVWRNGFVKYHRHQQEKKTIVKKLDAETQRAYFDVWRGFLADQIKTRQLVARASEFARIYCYKTYYTLWKIYRQRQKMKRQQLARAGKYYTNRLLRKGVDVLEEIVNEASQNVQRSHHIRRRTRMFLRAKCFDGWKRWADTGKHRRCLSAAFQQRNRYLRSWFNPYRRAWNEWRSFTRERVQERQMDGLYLNSLRCKAFAAWRRRAQLMTMISKRQQALTFTACACVFSFWRSRVTHRQEVREVIDLARAVYRRKRCAATLREWSLHARKLQKLRRQSDCLDEITKVKVSEKWFRVWNTLYHHRNIIFQHQVSRSTRWKRACFERWRQYIALRVKLKHKLAYFQQVFGKYPTTALLRRDWVRWKQYTRTGRSIRLFRCHQRCKFLQTWWAHWKLFHVFCFAFREWRRVAAQTALESGHFGERLRLFYKARKNRLLLSLLRQWVEFYRNKQSYRENVLSLRYEALREIIAWSVKAKRAMKSYMKSWFSRWYGGVHSRNKASTHYWEARLQRKVLILWWRLMVHSKQELVLSEAKQVLGNMSFYHPKQQVYTNAIKEKMIRHQHARDPSTSMAASQNARLKPMRRMLDPKEKKRYASAYRCEQLAGDSKRVTSFEVEGVSQVRRRTRGACEIWQKPGKYGKVPGQRKSATHDRPQQDELASQHVGFDRNNGSEQRNALRSTFTQCSPQRVRSADRVVSCHTYEGKIQNKSEPNYTPSLRRCESELLANQINTTLRMDEQGLSFDGDSSAVLFQQHVSTSCSSQRQSATSQTFDELPLFDTDIHERALPAQQKRDRKPTQPCQPTEIERVGGEHVLAPPQAPNALRMDSERAVTYPRTQEEPQDANIFTKKTNFSEREISLECLASMDLYERSSYAFETPNMVNAVTLPSKGSTPSYVNNAKARRQQAIKPKSTVPSTKNESLSLSTILDLPEQTEKNGSDKTKAKKGGAPDDIADEVNDSEVLNEILNYYASELVDTVEEKENVGSKALAKRKRIFFRVLRDLGLFHNDFYFAQMEAVVETMNHDHILLYHERAELPLERGEKKYLHQLEVEYLERFLDKVLENHPLYERYYDNKLKENRFGSRFASSSSSITLPTLRWLVQTHLQPWNRLSKRRQRPSMPFWVRTPVPEEMLLALDKLMLCVKKYYQALVQLFSTSLVGTSQRGRCGSAERMTKDEFMEFLRQMQVFPQLFHRREVEKAFDAACCSSSDQKDINLPEFIEAIIRCSSSLQWGDGAASSDKGESGITVRFLMLLFAMEGKGTILQKRNEDLQVVLGFVKQKQAEKKAVKMHRFRKLLTGQKQQRQVGVWPSLRRSNHSDNRTTWRNQLRSNYSDGHRSASPYRGESANLFYCGDPERAFISAHNYHSPDRDGFKLSLTASTHLMRQAQSPDEFDNFQLPYETELASPPETEDERYPQPLDVPSKLEIEVSTCAINVKDEETVSPVEFSAPDNVSSILCTKMKSSVIDSDSDAFDVPTSRTYTAGDLRDRNEFLDEILSSIGDVELVLQQSNLQLKRRSSIGSVLQEPADPACKHTPQQQAASVIEETYSDDFDDESCDSLTSNIMQKMFATRNSTVRSNSYSQDELPLSDQVEDIHVHDPMLNQLTQIERFTDTSEWQAQPSLEEIAHHGIHATFPSSLHTATIIEDSTLNRLTDPTCPSFLLEATQSDDIMTLCPSVCTGETI